MSTLEDAGVPAYALLDFPALISVAASGEAGALLVTAESLSPVSVKELAQLLESQPSWSDLPVLILIPGGRESRLIGGMEHMLRVLPNLTLLERPIRPVTLASVAKAALKSRARQYEVRRILREKEETAAAMVQSEKLAAVGRLASSIAHEINNPLEAVTNLLYLIRGEAGLSQAGRDYMDTADRELARVSQIASQTLRFHRQSTAASAVKPEALLEEVVELYKSRLTSSQIQLQREYEPGVEVTCFEGDIRQVLSNLVGNAFDVMRNGGHLRLRTRECTWWPTGEAGVLVTVADDGPGMPEPVRKRVFDAFYSTKGIHGTGLGLWISKRIVHKHQGHLRVRSRTGEVHGTVFHLWLPFKLAASAGEAWPFD